MTNTKLNALQIAYLAAKVVYDEVSAEYYANASIFDDACIAAGDPEGAEYVAFNAAWMAANPDLAAKGDRLCAAQNAARRNLEAAAEALLDWAFGVILPLASAANRADLLKLRHTTNITYRGKAIDLAMRLAA